MENVLLEMAKRGEIENTYNDVYRSIVKMIENKIYQPWGKLPSENELSEHYKVKRSVIRKTINKLIDDGFVFPLRNKGYFVKWGNINVRITKNSNYTSGMKSRGMQPKVKLLEIKTVSPNSEQKELFKLGDHDVVWYIKVLRYYKNIPYLFGQSYIPFDRMPDFGLHYKNFMSIYKVFNDIYNIKPQRKSSSCVASNSDKRESKLLSIFEHAPVLRVKSINVDQNGNPIELCISTFRSDLVQLNINL